MIGVVVMAYGSPAAPDDVLEYYTHIRRGRPPTDEQLADLQRRYEAIGGMSPLFERTDAQRATIQRALDEMHGPGTFDVRLGQKHAAPFLEDVVSGLVDDRAEQIVGLVLAPHYSKASVGEYHERAREAAGQVAYTSIDSWHLEPAYLDFLAAAVRDARAELPAKHKVLFTAHSLPERVLVDDPYPTQLRETAAAVAERVGMLPWPDWAIAWQSAGRTPDPWRGPDILEVIRDLAATGRSEGVLVCAQGFTSDHLEILYDLDIDASNVAEENGLRFARTRSINDDPGVMRALASSIAGAAGMIIRSPDRGEPALQPSARPRRRGRPRARVVVVGAGISGLTAAYRLAADHPEIDVTVVEEGDRLGGKLRTSSLGSRDVDEGADAFLARVDAGRELCEELGLADQLVTPAARNAYVYSDGELHPFPDGLVLGVPTDLDALARSGIVSDGAVERARRDLTDPGEPLRHDDTVGNVVRARVGDEVFERLVAPLLSGVNAGDADELSIEAGAPQLWAAAREGGSLIEALRRQRDAALGDRTPDDDPPPVFYGLRGGMQTLTDRLADRIGELGGTIRTYAPAHAIDVAWLPARTRPLYTVRLGVRSGVAALEADAVIITSPAYAAARLLEVRAPAVAKELADIDYASVVMVSLAVPTSAIGRELDGSGFLVPRDAGLRITACSWASSKWAHLGGATGEGSASREGHGFDGADEDGAVAILRVSVGHHHDPSASELDRDELRAIVLADLSKTIGLDPEAATGAEVRITPWSLALPQFRPGHLDRARARDERLWSDAPGLFLAGAHTRGLGIPACVTQACNVAKSAADLVL